MIELKNGHRFSVAASSGALAYGRGWWWDRWLLGWAVRPGDVTVITKTLTLGQRVGNLRMWCPWRCVRVSPLSGNCLNAVGLTNPGWEWWRGSDEPRQVIASIMPTTVHEAAYMAYTANDYPLIGLEYNASCPNVGKHDNRLEIFRALHRNSRHPIGIKLGWDDGEICQQLDGAAAWFSLINTVPYRLMRTDRSPLHRLGGGGLSGPQIAAASRRALEEAAGLRTPVLSGGGIADAGEAIARLRAGAGAVSLGTVYLTRPWRVPAIIRAVGEYELRGTAARLQSGGK